MTIIYKDKLFLHGKDNKEIIIKAAKMIEFFKIKAFLYIFVLISGL